MCEKCVFVKVDVIVCEKYNNKFLVVYFEKCVYVS
jgi:hypothetical protein